MPSCRDCRMLENDTCRAVSIAKETLQRQLPPPPLGACMIPIVENYLQLIEPGMTVLDVGCGSWSWIRDRCIEVKATYEGIDILEEYQGRKTVATRLENLAELSYSDETFDLVIGNQTMEHWQEYGCSLEWGLYQCFRVTKPGGQVLLNVPIHFHGTKEFMLGQFDRLREAFSYFSDNVTIESWGKPCDPLPAPYPHPGYPPLRNRPAYVVDIHATRDRPLPTTVTNEAALSGRIAQLKHYPLSYSVYRVMRKVGLVPRHNWHE